MTLNKRRLSAFALTNHRNISKVTKTPQHNLIKYGKTELDSHADSIVAGSNCCIMHYTNRECDVSPYRDDYTPIKNVPIVQAATALTSQYTGQTYILIFNEALWMGDQMDHTLVNPNQLRHFGIKVQDNPVSNEPLHIMTEDKQFNMELKMKGTTIFAETFTPSDKDLNSCPHIIMS